MYSSYMRVTKNFFSALLDDNYSGLSVYSGRNVEARSTGLHDPLTLIL